MHVPSHPFPPSYPLPRLPLPHPLLCPNMQRCCSHMSFPGTLGVVVLVTRFPRALATSNQHEPSAEDALQQTPPTGGTRAETCPRRWPADLERGMMMGASRPCNKAPTSSRRAGDVSGGWRLGARGAAAARNWARSSTSLPG